MPGHTRPVRQDGYTKEYEPDHVISMTLMTKSGPIDYKRMHDEDYTPWYQVARDWAEEQIRNRFLSSRAYRRNNIIMVFTHTFLDEAQRNKFYESPEYAASKAKLAQTYDIFDEVTLDYAAGHGGHPSGG